MSTKASATIPEQNDPLFVEKLLILNAATELAVTRHGLEPINSKPHAGNSQRRVVVVSPKVP